MSLAYGFKSRPSHHEKTSPLIQRRPAENPLKQGVFCFFMQRINWKEPDIWHKVRSHLSSRIHKDYTMHPSPAFIFRRCAHLHQHCTRKIRTHQRCGASLRDYKLPNPPLKIIRLLLLPYIRRAILHLITLLGIHVLPIIYSVFFHICLY